MPQRPAPLRVLVTAPRPADLEPIPSRMHLEALLDALEDQGDQLDVAWLWPNTWEALASRLADAAHVPASILCLDAPLTPAADGAQICFERPEGDKTFPIGQELFDLLVSHEVALLIARPISVAQLPPASPRASFAAWAAKSALPVLLIAPELPPETLRQAISAFLAALLAGESLATALKEAHTILVDARGQQKWRPEEALALYAGDADRPLVQPAAREASGIGKVIRFPKAGLSAAWRNLPAPPAVGALPSEPSQGFWGRAAELVAIEHALRSPARGGVWLYGHLGVGKTTLMAHAARWLVRTGRFTRVVYSSFYGGGLPEAALAELGKRLVGEAFRPTAEDALAQVEAALAETPTLVIWDNLEAVFREGEFAYEADAWQQLCELAGRIASAGDSRLCMLSDTLSRPDQAASLPLTQALAIPPLVAGDGVQLLTALLREARAPLPERQVLEELIALLGAHPLTLCILSYLLSKASAPEILAGLEAQFPGLRRGEARSGNQALEMVITYLLSPLEGPLRGRLYGLGVFRDGAMQPFAGSIAQLEEGEWDALRQMLAAARLLRLEELPGFTVPYVHLHPALASYLERRMTGEHRENVQRAYCQSHLGLLSWFSQADERARPVIANLERLELPDLRRAMRLMLSLQDLDLALNHLRYLGRVLDEMGLQGERGLWSKRFDEMVNKAIPSEGPLGRSAVRFMLNQCESLAAMGHAAESGMMLQQLVERIGKEDGLSYGGKEAAYDRGVAFHRLGRLMRAAGRMDLVLQTYVAALQHLEAAPLDQEVQQEMLSLHEDASEALALVMQFDAAEQSATKGLALAEALQDKAAMGRLHMRLGVICVARDQLEAARRHYEDALALFTELGDTAQVAAVWDQLGDLARRTDDLPEAERLYSRSLEAARRGQHVLREAQALTRLAQVAERQGRNQEAERCYAEAIALYEKHNVAPALLTTQAALAEMLLRQGDPKHARVHAEAARATAERMGPNVHPYQVYSLLQRIAKAEGQAERAVYWRTQAQEAFACSPEAQAILQQWRPLIRSVTGSCRGEALSVETVEAVEQLEKSEEWQQLALAIWRILGGERGPELYTELDHVDALVVRTILDGIARPPEDEGEKEN